MLTDLLISGNSYDVFRAEYAFSVIACLRKNIMHVSGWDEDVSQRHAALSIKNIYNKIRRQY
jgi:hypothetical protein